MVNRGAGWSRRSFLQWCAGLCLLMGVPRAAVGEKLRALERAPRPPVIWLQFQECTGCSESLLRAFHPGVENLILEMISLEYHETLMAAAGHRAEAARRAAMAAHRGEYLLVVEGSIPTAWEGHGCRIAGQTAQDLLKESVASARAVIAVGSCAAFGGLPMARPDPTGARPVSHWVRDKPLIHLPGCPPMPEAMAGLFAYYLLFKGLPELDRLHRPRLFYGDTIHDRCPRRPFYERGQFADTFDDAGARQGWCLFKLGCKGPVTHNACATRKWNGGVSFPIQSGHGCLGCSEPRFWDHGGFYEPLPVPVEEGLLPAATAAVVGAAVGAWEGRQGRRIREEAEARHTPATLDDLEKKP